MNIKNPEILAPGGDFNSAIHALNNGADAVYIGLTSFSARKKAKNFTINELRRLRTFCVERKKKIYVAINTLLKDIELEKLYPIIKELEEIEVDAIIVQDLGLAKLIKESTNLTIHASTQLAVHNLHGVRIMSRLGFSRVVLSRELSLPEIAVIKQSIPNLELEIFIHGALCYGFSGLCLASSKITGRSANRGECAQICRTWFNNKGKKEYCFSLNDLSLQKKILQLREIGIESLKIEGRMKGPGYASTTSKLYYNILHNIDFRESLRQSEIEFNRNGHDAYLENNNGLNNININYPGHSGLVIGKVISREKYKFTAQINGTIKNRDGLMVLDNKNPPESIKFAANIDNQTGEIYKFKYQLPLNYDKTLYKISSHNKHLKEEKPISYKPWKTDIKLSITINKDSITISEENSKYTFPVTMEESKTFIDLNKSFNKSFYAGGDSNYHFPVEVINNSRLTAPFIPGSKLKEIRNTFQKEFIKNRNIKHMPEKMKSNIPQKSYIKNSSGLPFIVDFNNINLKELVTLKGSYLLPLSPVIFDSEFYLKELKKFLNKNTNKQFIIGLNNICHISFIQELPKELKYYCDYGLYNLNNYTLNFYEETIPRLLWVTRWIEEDKLSDFPPIFISRTCFKAQKTGCPENCRKNFEFKISQKSNQKIIVKNCISYTFMES